MSDTVVVRMLDWSENIHGLQRNSALQLFR